MKRRDFLKLGAGAAAAPFFVRSACALDYPTRAVQVIVGQAAASSSDITARLVSQYLSQHFGQQFVVEVRPGATGNIATEQVVHAAPDGYTLLVISLAHAVDPAIYKEPFDPIKDFTPVAILATGTNVLTVNPNVPVHSVKELIERAKAKPGTLNYASAGIGSFQNLSGELFKLLAGVDIRRGTSFNSPSGFLLLWE